MNEGVNKYVHVKMVNVCFYSLLNITSCVRVDWNDDFQMRNSSLRNVYIGKMKHSLNYASYFL